MAIVSEITPAETTMEEACTADRSGTELGYPFGGKHLSWVVSRRRAQVYAPEQAALLKLNRVKQVRTGRKGEKR